MVLDLNNILRGEPLEVHYNGRKLTLYGNTFSISESMPSPMEVSFRGMRLLQPTSSMSTLNIKLSGNVGNVEADEGFTPTGYYDPYMTGVYMSQKSVSPEEAKQAFKMTSKAGSIEEAESYFNSDQSNWDAIAESEVNSILGIE